MRGAPLAVNWAVGKWATPLQWWGSHNSSSNGIRCALHQSFYWQWERKYSSNGTSCASHQFSLRVEITIERHRLLGDAPSARPISDGLFGEIFWMFVFDLCFGNTSLSSHLDLIKCPMFCGQSDWTHGTQGCISCGILVSGIWARGVSLEHMENMEMFSCSPT